MSTTRSKQELTRLAWTTALRQQGDRQCARVYRIDTMVCALTLLWEVAGKPDLGPRHFNKETIGKLAGLSRNQSCEVVARNDGDRPFHQHAFSEVADVVDGWFKPQGE